MFDRIERTAKLIQNISIIFGIGVSGMTLVYTQYEKRVDRAIEYKKEFNGQYSDKYNTLILSHGDFGKMHSQDILGADSGAQEKAVIRFYAENKNDHILNILLDFFDNLWVCVKHHSCDRDSAIDLFDSQIRALFESSAFYIFRLRKDQHDESVGVGLERLYHYHDHREGLFEKLFPEIA